MIIEKKKNGNVTEYIVDKDYPDSKLIDKVLNHKVKPQHIKTIIKDDADVYTKEGKLLLRFRKDKLKKENIIQIKEDKGHTLGCCKNADTQFVNGINIFSDSISLLRFLPFFPINEQLYTFILHSNGVIRFRINDNIPYIYKLSNSLSLYVFIKFI